MNRMRFLSTGLLALLAATPGAFADEKARSDGPVYELRIYTTPDGKLPALHKRFRDHTVKLFAKHGMTNVVYWTPEGRKNTLVYLLKHDDKKARDKSFAGFRADADWQKAYKASRADGPLVSKVESTLLQPTDYSPKSFAKAKPGWIYELRTYTTRPGRLPALNARFRDHTRKLFEKHGMHNALYTTPLDEKTGDVTLVYVIAHKDRKTADASWKSFIGDPAWKKVAAESQKDGAILVKGGVERMYLSPTDYSPVK